MNTQSFTNGTSRLSRAVRRLECGTHLCYELSTSQFSDMKVRRLTRQYGFSVTASIGISWTRHSTTGVTSCCGARKRHSTGMPLWKMSQELSTAAYRSACSMTSFSGSTGAWLPPTYSELYGPCQVLWHALPVSWYPQGVRTFGQLMYYPL